eukprot:COSAG01_NODE_71559_length_255_cov_1.179487_1_plen_24_part_10
MLRTPVLLKQLRITVDNSGGALIS